MIDVGVVGLDTSHPETFAHSIDDHDAARVGAVWDGGAVREPSYVREFCDAFDATMCEDRGEMVPLVDAVMVLTVNWDTHVDFATPFLDAGVPTFVDKPVAGRVGDVQRLADVAGSTPLLGGSSIPYHPSLETLSDDSPGETLYAVGYNDPFYYGPHVVHTVRHLVDADWHTVTPASDPGATVDVLFENDAYATIRLDGPTPLDGGGFGFMSVGDGTNSVLVDGDSARRERMYDAFIAEFVESARDGTDDRERLLDGARLLVAVHAALDGNTPITPESPALERYHADGTAFLEGYRSR